jgi:hypothetical protein
MANNGFGSRSIVAAICLLLAVGGIYKNIEQGIPANALPRYATSLRAKLYHSSMWALFRPFRAFKYNGGLLPRAAPRRWRGFALGYRSAAFQALSVGRYCIAAHFAI